METLPDWAIPVAVLLILIASQLFWLRRLIDFGERFIPGKRGRAALKAVIGVLCLFFFAYLLVPPERSLTQETRARLAAIVEFADLGAGFRIAARDLEIRGAGNLLGAEQHGHLRAVGYETYCRLLEEAVQELRGEARPASAVTVELRLGLDLRIPESYIDEETLRLAVYRRIASTRTDAERLGLIEKAMGAFLVLTGVLIFTGQLANIAFWLLEIFPVLNRLG